MARFEAGTGDSQTLGHIGIYLWVLRSWGPPTEADDKPGKWEFQFSSLVIVLSLVVVVAGSIERLYMGELNCASAGKNPV